MKSFKQSASVLLALVLLASGCAHHPINAPLAAVDGRTGYHFESAAFSTNSDDLFLMLAFSGGGMRAAALDYGVLEELARTGVGPPTEHDRPTRIHANGSVHNGPIASVEK